MHILSKVMLARGRSGIDNQRGVTILLVAILMVVFIGIAALAIDLSHLYVVRNELQNAADSGALAGARWLYNEDGTRVNDAGYTTMDGKSIPSANKMAYDAAIANRALAENEGAIAVEVWDELDPVHSGDDIQRGHWSFANHRFQANDATDPPDLTQSTQTLDGDSNFINAVRVVTRRQATPAASFFARAFSLLTGNEDWEHFTLSAEAIAYIGFAGDLGPGELDQPIAICKQSILFNDAYSCNTGRMLNSGSNTSTSNTGGWTNFSQPCDTADVPSLRPLICGDGNADSVSFGDGMGSVNGVQDTIFRDLEDCWRDVADSDGDGSPDTVWEVTLPVIDCPGNGVSNCAELLGAVTLKIIWVQRDNPGYDQVPREMYDPETDTDWPTDDDLDMDPRDLEEFFVGGGPSDAFPSFGDDFTSVSQVFYEDTEDSGRVRWASLVNRFNLRNVGPADSAPYATFAFKSIFFLPSCEPHEPRGNTGGENFGILAKIPKLVK